jgi:hypothetical protein
MPSREVGPGACAFPAILPLREPKACALPKRRGFRPAPACGKPAGETPAEAHSSLALIKSSYDWDWSGADKEIRRAIELNPCYADAHRLRAVVLWQNLSRWPVRIPNLSRMSISSCRAVEGGGPLSIGERRAWLTVTATQDQPKHTSSAFGCRPINCGIEPLGRR